MGTTFSSNETTAGQEDYNEDLPSDEQDIPKKIMNLFIQMKESKMISTIHLK